MSEISQTSNLWRTSDRRLSKLLDTSGFACPPLSDLRWTAIGNPSEKNFAVVSSDSPAGHIPTIEMRPGSRDNILLYGRGSKAIGKHVIRGSNNTVIMAGNNPEPLFMNISIAGSGCLLFVGSGSTCVSANVFVKGKNGNVIIGEKCMLSHNIAIRNSDDHAIFDLESGKHFNTIEDVFIEPYVWIGPESHILKGVRIGFGSIVGERSLVTNNVERCSLVAGVPARTIRKGVSWDRNVTPTPEINRSVNGMLERYVDAHGDLSDVKLD